MKQIKENKKLTTIILEEGDILEIYQGKNKEKFRITHKKHTLYFDNIPYKDLINIIEEKKAIQTMKRLLK